MAVAQQVGAEIASVDAFQIYRGLDIGTGKPTREEQGKVRHHLIDLVDPAEEFSSAQYAKEAERVGLDLAQRKVSSLWVGGTGLYHRVLTRGLSKAPATDAVVGQRLEQKGTGELAEEVHEGRSEVGAGGRFEKQTKSDSGAGGVGADGKKIVGLAGKGDTRRVEWLGWSAGIFCLRSKSYWG